MNMKISSIGTISFVTIFVILTTWVLVSSTDASAMPEVYICHCQSHECRTLHIAAKAADSHLSRHEKDYSGQCVEPTPSVSPTPSPSLSPTPSPSPSPVLTNCSNYVNVSTPIVVDDFNSYTNGSVVGQGGWQSYVNGSHFLVQGTVVNEGAKALYNNFIGDHVLGKQGISRADGKQAICVRSENRAGWGNGSGTVGVRVSKGLNASGAPGLSFASVGFQSDGDVVYYDQVTDSYVNFATYNDNEWTLLEIEWRSSDKTARYRVNSGTWTGWELFANRASFSGFDYVNVAFVNLPSGSGGAYYDTLK